MAAMIRRLASALFLLAVSVHASAAFETRWSRFGNDTVIHDTSTGINWLRLDLTTGLSYNDVYAQLDTTFSGYSIAGSEVFDLVRSMGIVDTNSPAAQLPQSAEFIESTRQTMLMFGAQQYNTSFAQLSLYGHMDSGLPFLQDADGITLPGSGTLTSEPMWVRWSPTHVDSYDDYIRFKPIAYEGVGTFLMATPVPEPSTYALMLAGVALLVWHTRRNRGFARL
jgi:hypothetical protein